MLAKRIIPTLLCRGRQLFKGRQFKSWRSVGLVAQAMRVHQSRGVDEIILLDIMATNERRGPDLELIEEISDGFFSPLTVGGGVKSIQDVDALLRAGADKVAICSAALTNRSDLIQRCADRFGSQCIVAVVEYNLTKMGIRVTTSMNGAREHAMQPDALALHYQHIGAGEVMLNAIHLDGMMQGYDFQLIQFLKRNMDIPLIVSGGCGSYEDMEKAIRLGADGVATGAMLQWTDNTPRGAAEYLKSKGIEVRLEERKTTQASGHV